MKLKKWQSHSKLQRETARARGFVEVFVHSRNDAVCPRCGGQWTVVGVGEGRSRAVSLACVGRGCNTGKQAFSETGIKPGYDVIAIVRAAPEFFEE